jgi:hypothetical protein
VEKLKAFYLPAQGNALWKMNATEIAPQRGAIRIKTYSVIQRFIFLFHLMGYDLERFLMSILTVFVLSSSA